MTTSHLLLDAATATGAGTASELDALDHTYTAWLTSAGGTATVDIEVTNDPRAKTDPSNAAWGTLATFSLSGASDDAAFKAEAKWRYVRANCTANSSATVSVRMGV